jgi:hypothetical protein
MVLGGCGDPTNLGILARQQAVWNFGGLPSACRQMFRFPNILVCVEVELSNSKRALSTKLQMMLRCRKFCKSFKPNCFSHEDTVSNVSLPAPLIDLDSDVAHDLGEPTSSVNERLQREVLTLEAAIQKSQRDHAAVIDKMKLEAHQRQRDHSMQVKDIHEMHFMDIERLRCKAAIVSTLEEQVAEMKTKIAAMDINETLLKEEHTRTVEKLEFSGKMAVSRALAHKAHEDQVVKIAVLAAMEISIAQYQVKSRQVDLRINLRQHAFLV